MKIVPDSTINLYSGVDIGSEQQLAFSSKAKQTAYFNSKLLKSNVNCTVVKEKVGTVRIAISPVGHAGTGDITGAQVATCNFMSFINPSFDNKVIYCRILDYRYMNNETCEIVYMIDYWQTWMFDVSYKDMYIDREHLNVTDWNKAEANPYDQSISQFLTSEPLPYGKELEKPNYQIQFWAPESSSIPNDWADTDGKMLNTTAPDIYDNVQANPTLTKQQTLIRGWFSGGHAFWNAVVYVTPIKFDDIGPDAKAEWEDIIWNGYSYPDNGPGSPFCNIPAIKLPAGNMDFNLLYYSVVPEEGGEFDPTVGMDKVACLWSNRTRACDIYIVQEPARLKRMIDFLTYYGLVSSIVSMYAVPKFVTDRFCFGERDVEGLSHVEGDYSKANTADQVRVVSSKVKLGQTPVTNKKLLNFPYSYIRVTGPDGSEKEYQYDKFQDIASGSQNYGQFKIIVECGESAPKMYLIPYKYGAHNDYNVADVGKYQAQINELSQYNLNEAMVIDNFPQMAYNTDGYLTYLSGEYMARTAAKTADLDLSLRIQNAQLGVEEKNYAVGTLGSIGSTALTAAGQVLTGNYLGAVSTVFGGSAGITQNMNNAQLSMAIRRETLENERAKNRESSSWIENADTYKDIAARDMSGDYVERYDKTRPAHASSVYHAGTGNLQSSQFMLGMGIFDFQAVNVQLRPEIIQRYDEYFNMYGYNTTRCGIPYLINFIKGETSNDKVPHWATIDSKPATYLKTIDAKVEHAMEPVAAAIAGMLNNGVRFVKGDLN